MARERGTFNFSASLEIKKQGALDSRLVVQTYDELKSSATWADTDNLIWLYDGMIVSVVADTGGKNGIYLLTNKDQYTTDGAWTRVDAAAAAQTEIIDNLTSSSTTAALSANQGRVLDGKITAVDTKVDDFIATKGQNNGLASLDENGLVPTTQLPSYVDDVIDVYATYDTDDTGALSNIKIYSDDAHANPVTGEAGKIYVNITPDQPAYQFRWTGTTFTQVGASSLIIGTVTGTAYDGGLGNALSGTVTAHTSNTSNPHNVTAAQVGLGNVDNTSDADKPVSTAQQAALDGKVDKVAGSSLVPDTEITKLAGLKAQSEITSDIQAVQTNVNTLGTRVTNITGESGATYTPNDSANYIAEATSLKDADSKLDAQIKANADAIAALTGGEGGSIQDQIDSAIDGLKGGASAEYDTLKEIEDAIKAETTARTQADAQLDGDITALEGTVSALDTAVAPFKNKTVSTTLAKPGNDTSLPTTKAVVDYITTATNGVANNMTYTQKAGDATKMELKLIAVSGATLATVELDKENFISNFQKKTAEEEDHTADNSIAIGDPILVVTTVNGQVFRVNLKDLVDVYTGGSTNSITVNVSGYNITADLKVDSTTQASSPVKLTVGANGLSADIQLNSTTNGTQGITLSKDASGLAAALKIDTATNTANGVEMVVGANGLSMGIVWTEL